jgi:8-oxo-dGTP pyrophosphatase MutT (NUDIX family)
VALRHRLSSRVLLFDREGSILMLLTTGDNGKARWLTPGGGVDPGESHADAAIRELFEETGLSGVELAGPVFSLDFDATYGAKDHDTGHAEYYTAIVDRFELSDAGWTEDEKVDMLDHKWWTLDELVTTTEPYEPDNLVELVRTHSGRSGTSGRITS